MSRGSLFAGANVTGNIVIGNRIGTDSLGTTAIPNVGDGIHIANGSGNVIGGTAVGAAESHLGQRRRTAYRFPLRRPRHNIVLSNLIGTNNSGMSAIGNGANGWSSPTPARNTIGVANGGNVISGNGLNGIAIFGAASIGNQIYANRIGANFQATAPIGNHAGRHPHRRCGDDGHRRRRRSLRNVIGGNVQHGIGLYDGASGTRIAGNTIGFSAPLTFLGNGLEGIQINNASNTTIGGPAAEQANMISQRPQRRDCPRRHGQPDRRATNLRQRGPRHRSRQRRRHGERRRRRRTGPNNRQNFPVLTAGGGRAGHAEQHAGLAAS